jgi:ribosomal protein S12 methylthiotransferase accessory factor
LDIAAFATQFDVRPSLAGARTGMVSENYSDRICPPEETFRRVSPLMDKYGITRIARQTGLDHIGIPVWSAIRPNSLSLAVNNGKGIADADARISAVMEALERAVAGEPELVSRLTTLKALEAEGLSADSLVSLIGKGHEPIGHDSLLPWAQGYDLISARAIWIPLHAIMLDRTAETPYWQSSDGLASGNTQTEAVFHGLLERIERDADLLWSLARKPERASRCIDTAAFHDAIVDRLATAVRDAGLALQVFDITSDIGVPCFQALIGPVNISERRAVLYAEAANGSGCHPDPVRAVIRAITEAAQSRLTLVSGSRDDIGAEIYDLPMPKGLIEDFNFETAARALPVFDTERRSLPEMLHTILAALRERAIGSVIAVPLNPADAPFSVVKVLVPGLENPSGPRRIKFGKRGLARMMRLG